jgi:hypothetical protein
MNPLKVIDFIKSMGTGRPGEYRSCPGGDVTLYASCFAVMTLHYLGQLKEIKTEEREMWAKYIQGWQDPETGYFVGPEIVKEELTSPIHDYEHVSMHLAGHVLPALALLGKSPLHPLRFAWPFLEKAKLLEWLARRNWKRAWLEGNNLLFIGQFLIHLRDVDRKREAGEALNLLFDWLDKRVDPSTGLWGTNGFCPPFEAMCGGYHQLLLYYYENRPVLNKSRLVDTVLALQHADGGFSPNGGGGACEDTDAADILVNMYKQSEYRRADIRAALERLLESIKGKQRPDGGFVYRVNEPFTHLGVLKTKSPANTSNMFATWFRIHTIALINEILGKLDWNFGFNNVCSMGWHRAEKI